MEKINMYNFQGQLCIVTGGTRGIGAAISQAFLEAGANVIAIYAQNSDAATQFKTKLGILGEKLELAQVDVSSTAQCEVFFKNLEKSSRTVSVLINNSGIRKDNLLPTMKEEEWDQVLDINLKGTFNMCKFAVLNMLRARYGRIINMSSVAAIMGLQGQANYSASKAGQIALGKSLAKEVGKKGITVNSIAPGFIETELITDLPKELVEEYKKQIPLKRFGTVAEVSHAVLFLASKEASYITGATLEISGGLV